MGNHFDLLSVNFVHENHLILAQIWNIRGNRSVEFLIPLGEISFN